MIAYALFATCLLGPDVKAGLVYRTVDGTPVHMDLYLPEKPVSSPTPFVVMIHGGAWIGGSRTEMTPFATALAEKGVAVANIDYRLAPKHKWPAQIDDCVAAVRYLWTVRDQYGLRMERYGAIGGSAGSHLAMLLGFTDGWGPGSGPSTRASAVVNIFGPTDLSNDFEKNLANMLSTQVLGKKYDEAATEIASFSPVTYVDAKSSPVYSIQGKADPLVPHKQASRLDDAMKAAERPHTLVLVEGMGHALSSKDEDINKKIKEEFNKSLDWLVEQIK